MNARAMSRPVVGTQPNKLVSGEGNTCLLLDVADMRWQDHPLWVILCLFVSNQE